MRPARPLCNVVNRSGMEHVVRPIGFVRSPFVEKVQAPRQSCAGRGAQGQIEILPRYEHALADLEGFDRIWVLFWFDRAGHAPAKVLPPRSAIKRGVFATRSPHRPNPIGMSAVRLERIEGLCLHVCDLDILDRTPVLDLKPYLPYADAFVDAKTGWLDAPDPLPAWRVEFSETAEQQLAWLSGKTELELRERIVQTLALGPEPHPYRRIRRLPEGGFVLAIKEWRAAFSLPDGSSIRVERIATGYRARDLALGSGAMIDTHRQFVAAFG
jgi:tRNA-Thr(GGU) m(6)t(6)A37 methyltransferase TsaA